MEINGITIPDPAVTKQLIADTIGGWVYEVTTTVTVEQTRLDTVSKKLDDARIKLEEAQREYDHVNSEVTAIQNAIPTKK